MHLGQPCLAIPRHDSLLLDGHGLPLLCVLIHGHPGHHIVRLSVRCCSCLTRRYAACAARGDHHMLLRLLLLLCRRPLWGPSLL